MVRYLKSGASELEREAGGGSHVTDSQAGSSIGELAREGLISMVDGLLLPGLTKLLFRGNCHRFRGGARRAGFGVLLLLPGLCVSVLAAVMSFLKSFPPPGSAEGLRQQQPDTEAVLNGKGLGTGTLYIAER